jgi:hypothetical protein
VNNCSLSYGALPECFPVNETLQTESNLYHLSCLSLPTYTSGNSAQAGGRAEFNGYMSLPVDSVQSETTRVYKGIPLTGREGPYGCQTSRLPHFLDNQFTDGGEVVSVTRRSGFTSRKITGTHFC